MPSELTGNSDKKPKVYISGPLTTGKPMQNVHMALDAATRLMHEGFVPFVPHLTWFWEGLYRTEFSYNDWLAWDMEWLDVCDAMLRLPGDSFGANKEARYATNHEIPIFYSVYTLKKWFADKDKNGS